MKTLYSHAAIRMGSIYWSTSLKILFFCLACFGFSTNKQLLSQPWTYDFGTGTGTANNANSGTGNTTFFPGTPTNGGTYRVRIGTQGGSLVLANPGTSLGTGSEAQLTAATGSSSNKFTVYGWNSPSTSFYIKFKIRNTSSGNGVFALHIGSGASGTIYQDNNSYTNYTVSLTTLLINYSGGAISSVQRRIDGSFTTISGSGIAKDTDQEIEIFANNASGTATYNKGGSYTLNSQSWDMWVDGTKISPAGGWPKAGTWAAGNNIAGFGFFAESSTGNAAVLYLDDLEYSNAYPTGGPSPEITTTGTLSSFNTNYGTPSSSDSYTVSGTDLNTGITITPPVGFEVSPVSDFSDSVGTNTSPLIVGSAGNLPAKTIYVRLSGSTGAGTYAGNISHTSTGATTKNVAIPSSTIQPLSITVSGATASNKIYDGNTSAVVTGGTLSGVLPGDVADVSISGGTFNNKNVGTNKTVTINLSGAKAANYVVSTTLTADIQPKELTISGATAQSKVYDGNADAVVTGTLTGVISPDVVSFTQTGLFDNASPGFNKPVTFTGTLTGADAGNYFLTAPTGLTANIYACTDTVYWAFTTDSPDNNSAGSKVTVSNLDRGNNNGSTTLITNTSASTGYTGASGGNNAGAAAFTGPLNTATSTYFEFTLTPESSRSVTLVRISFGSRSTSTGPAAFSIRTSLDNYASNVATGTLSTGSVWQLQTPVLSTVTSGTGSPITVRIYGHNGTGSSTPGTANWRIDDLRLVLALTSVTTYDTVNACNAYTWPVNNTTYYSSTFVTEVVDCDTFNLNLTISTGSTTTTTVSACSTYFWTVNAQTYTASTIDTVISGCDTSILNLTITAPPTWYLDADSDGWYVSTQSSCNSPGSGWTNVLPGGGSGDCNDNVASVNPGATEVCNNSIDDNCDSNIDENCINCTGAPPTPGLISGPSTNVCVNTTQTYSVAPVSGATGYFWTTTGNITLASGQGTNTATFNFGPNFTTGSVRVQAYNQCDTSAVRLLSIKSATLPTPGPISGQSTQVCANTTYTYSIAPVSGATSYAWSVSGGNITLVGNPTGTTATFNFGPSFTTGTIRVQALNSCGGSGYRTLSITSVPTTPGVISGPSTAVCAGSTSVAYSILPVVNATGYVWSTIGNVSIASGQNTTNATFNFANTFTSGTIRVQASNACGLSAIRSLSVASTPPIPGTISGLLTGVIPNSSGNYSIASVAGASSYLWEVTGNATITSGVNTTTATVNFANSYTGGIIRVRAENICGAGPWRSATITAVVPRLAATTRSINLFPNPADNKVTIQSEGISSVLLFDVSGKVLQAQKYQSESQVELELDYPSGIYFIEIAGDGWREVRKLIVR